MFRIDRSRVNIAEGRELQVTFADSGTFEFPEGCIATRERQPDPCETARIKAEEIVEHARREADAARLCAEEVLQRAEIDAEKLKTEARQLGYELGYNEGRAEGEQQYDALINGHTETFINVLAELERAGETMISNMESDIIDLCFSVLRKITMFDRTVDGEIFKAMIKNAVSQVDLTGKVTIRLSHEDCARFFPDGVAVFDINDTSLVATVSSDPEFTDGDIAVDTESETVLASAETQLHNIEMAFKYRIGKENE